MLKIVLPICLLILVALAQAENPLFICKAGSSISKGAASQKLQALQQAYKSVETLAGDFTQESSSAALEVSEQSYGQVWFKKPGLMKWHYIQPDEQYFLVKEKKFWFYQVALNQVLIDRLEQVLLSEIPLSFLLGLGNLAQDFRVDSACKNVKGTLLLLSPVNQGSDPGKGSLQSFKVLMGLNNLPSAVSVVDSAGNTTTVLFKDLKSNIRLDSNLFALSLPTNVDLQDNSQS